MQCYPTTSRRCSEVVGSIRTAEDLEAMASMLRAEKEEVQVSISLSVWRHETLLP